MKIIQIMRDNQRDLSLVFCGLMMGLILMALVSCKSGMTVVSDYYIYDKDGVPVIVQDRLQTLKLSGIESLNYKPDSVLIILDGKKARVAEPKDDPEAEGVLTEKIHISRLSPFLRAKH